MQNCRWIANRRGKKPTAAHPWSAARRASRVVRGHGRRWLRVARGRAVRLPRAGGALVAAACLVLRPRAILLRVGEKCGRVGRRKQHLWRRCSCSRVVDRDGALARMDPSGGASGGRWACDDREVAISWDREVLRNAVTWRLLGPRDEDSRSAGSSACDSTVQLKSNAGEK